MTPKALLSAGLALLALTCLTGCPDPSQNDNAPAKLVAFSSSDELLDYFRDQAAAPYRPTRGFFGFDGDPIAAPAEDQSAGGSNGESDDGGFTATNTQEEGVDEADIIKTDGERIYIASDGALRIVQAVPADELRELATLEVEDGTIQELYLFGDHVIAIAGQFEFFEGDIAYEIWPPYYSQSSLRVYDIDVSDPADPQIVASLDLDGTLVSSRLTQDRLILVLAVAPQLPENPNVQTISSLGLPEILPDASSSGGSRDMVPWENWLRPESPDGVNMTAIVTLDAADIETIVSSTAVLASASTIYATQSAVYLTDAQYTPDGEARLTTDIHKFEFDPEGGAQYVASGSVPGRLLNQFSLSEHDGFLRVATHIEPTFFFGDDVVVGIGVGGGTVSVDAAPPPDGDVAVSNSGAEQDRDPTVPVNAVYVLGVTETEQETTLSIVGSAEDIAPNEQIYSARFMGDHGFLVTFRQIDPLFVLDLTDPENPSIAGELKIPGFSEYLHPLGDTRLIGVGRSVEENEFGGAVPTALQLSLFDVSDWSNPTVIQQMEIGGYGSFSEAGMNHKAFALLESENLLALPVWLNESDNDFEFDGFSGVLCLRIDPDAGFEELGRLGNAGGEFYGSWGTRAIVIGDTVYAANAAGVIAAPLSDFEAVSAVELDR